MGALPISIDWLPDGRMLIVSGREGLLLRREPDGSLVTHADLTDLAPPPWNDIVVDGRANAYVGNTGFDFPAVSYAPGRSRSSPSTARHARSPTASRSRTGSRSRRTTAR